VRFLDAEYPDVPYPGRWPGVSYVHDGGVGVPIQPDPGRLAGWRVGDRDLDDWLAERGAAPLAQRVPVLSYGSNRCPSKITWLRRELGLTGPVVLLAADTEDLAAVWASGLRARDGQRPAVLAGAPGVAERHAVWLATRAQLAVLDVCEGRGERYRLARLRTGSVRTEDGALVHRPWCYLGHSSIRRPLLTADPPDTQRRMVRCAELPQAEASLLVGVPAADDGLLADEVLGTPHPDEWPAALFAYGLLQPGRDGWRLVAPYVGDDPPRPASALGARYDTGLGWPALLLEPGQRARGTLIPLADPASALPSLDSYEGADYRRVRITLPVDGTVTWAYAWTGSRDGLRPTGHGSGW
jgi:gamma-glutamylcyclotransferase (GGCT)/AIG2-like uncharacterized protein YtfP